MASKVHISPSVTKRTNNLPQTRETRARRRRRLRAYNIHLDAAKRRGYWYVRKATPAKEASLRREAMKKAIRSLQYGPCKSMRGKLKLATDILNPTARRGFDILNRDFVAPQGARVRSVPMQYPTLSGPTKAPRGAYRYRTHDSALVMECRLPTDYRWAYLKNCKYFSCCRVTHCSFKLIIHFITMYGATRRLMRSIQRIKLLWFKGDSGAALRLSRKLATSLVQLSYNLGAPVVKPSNSFD